MKKLVVLASGNGSNLQAVINSQGKDFKIVAVICNIKTAFALQRAKEANIPTVFLPQAEKTRAEYDSKLAEVVAAFNPDYVFLLGWMRILTNSFLQNFCVINLHPALPGCFPGTNAIKEQFNACREGKIKHCGIMTHYVPDEGVDSGPVILTRNVELLPTDSINNFEERIHKNEHEIVIETIKFIINN